MKIDTVDDLSEYFQIFGTFFPYDIKVFLTNPINDEMTIPPREGINIVIEFYNAEEILKYPYPYTHESNYDSFFIPFVNEFKTLYNRITNRHIKLNRFYGEDEFGFYLDDENNKIELSHKKLLLIFDSKNKKSPIREIIN